MSRNEFLISILIPLYNVEKYVEKCLDSIFSNTIISDCEVIICNDGSTDSSFELAQKVCKEYPSISISLIDNKTNLGIQKVRSILLNSAKGKYFIFVDSDDYVEKNYLEDLYNSAEYNSADITGCNGIYEDVYGTVITPLRMPFSENCILTISDILKDKNKGFVWCRLIKRKFYFENNISWNPNISILEDFIVIIKILLCNPKISYVDKYLYHYLKRDGSIVSKWYSEKTIDALIIAFKEMDKILGNIESNELQNAYLIRKLSVRYDILFNADKRTLKKYFNAFPETDKVLFDSEIKYSNFKKRLMYLQSKNKTFSYILISFYRFLKKIR